MNKEMFRNMTLKQKLVWFLQYYGITTIVVLIAIGVGISLIKSFFFPEKGPDLSVLILSEQVYGQEILDYEDELCQQTGQDIEITGYLTEDVYGRMAFSAKMNYDQVDLVIAPQEEMQLIWDGGSLKECRKLTETDEELWMGIPGKAREGELLDLTMEYLEKHLNHMNE